MSEVAAPAETVPVATVAPPPKDWRETWARATAKAEAHEKAEAAKVAEAGAEADKALATEAAEAEAETADATADGESDDAEAGEGSESEDKADAKAKPEAKAAPDKAKRAELEKLAKELGLKVDARGVYAKERADFRERRERHKKNEQQFAEQVRAAWSVIEPLAKAKEAAESGDIDAALKALLGKDFAELSEEQVEQLRDPTQREVRELKKKLQAREESEAKARAEHEAKQREAAQEAERQRYMADLAAGLAKSEDVTIARATKSDRVGQHFATLVLREQEKAFDGYETISAEDAAAIARDNLRADYEALQEIFGDHGTDTVDGRREPDNRELGARGAGNPAVGGKKPPTTLPKRRAAEASAPGRQLTESEWTKKWAAQIRQASG